MKHNTDENFQYALVETRRKSVLAHAAQFCRAGTRIKYASSFLRFRISLGLNSEPSKPHRKGKGGREGPTKDVEGNRGGDEREFRR
jgi:hypothetical protein